VVYIYIYICMYLFIYRYMIYAEQYMAYIIMRYVI